MNGKNASWFGIGADTVREVRALKSLQMEIPFWFATRARASVCLLLSVSANGASSSLGSEDDH